MHQTHVYASCAAAGHPDLLQRIVVLHGYRAPLLDGFTVLDDHVHCTQLAAKPDQRRAATDLPSTIDQVDVLKVQPASERDVKVPGVAASVQQCARPFAAQRRVDVVDGELHAAEVIDVALGQAELDAPVGWRVREGVAQSGRRVHGEDTLAVVGWKWRCVDDRARCRLAPCQRQECKEK